MSQNNIYSLCGLWAYSIVPLAMEFVTDDVDLAQLLVRNLNSFGILIGIELALDCQACAGLR